MNFFTFFRNFFRTSSPLARLVMGLFVWLITSLTLLLFFEFASEIIFGVSLFRINFSAIETDSGALQLFKAATLIQSFSLFVAPPFVIAICFDNSVKEYLYLLPHPAKRTYLFSLLLIVAAIPLINFLDEINKMIRLPSVISGMDETEALIEKIYILFSKSPSAWVFLQNILIMALIPAIGEELMFRGVLQRMLADLFRNHHAGVFVCAFFFGAVHGQFHSVFPRFALGLLLGYALLWSGSIWIPMLMHFVNNLMNILYSMAQDRGWAGDKLERIGTLHDAFWLTILSVLILVLLLWMMYKEKKKVAGVS